MKDVVLLDHSLMALCGAVGLPFFFLAGFAWPAEAIPEPIGILSLLVPSTSAINGFVRLSQMGATLADVQMQFFILWGLAFAYARSGRSQYSKNGRDDFHAPVSPADRLRGHRISGDPPAGYEHVGPDGSP